MDRRALRHSGRVFDVQRSRFVLEQRTEKLAASALSGTMSIGDCLSGLTRDAVAARGMRRRHGAPVKGTDGRTGVVIPCCVQARPKEVKRAITTAKRFFITLPFELKSPDSNGARSRCGEGDLGQLPLTESGSTRNTSYRGVS